MATSTKVINLNPIISAYQCQKCHSFDYKRHEDGEFCYFSIYYDHATHSVITKEHVLSGEQSFLPLICLVCQHCQTLVPTLRN